MDADKKIQKILNNPLNVFGYRKNLPKTRKTFQKVPKLLYLLLGTLFSNIVSTSSCFYMTLSYLTLGGVCADIVLSIVCPSDTTLMLRLSASLINLSSALLITKTWLMFL